MKSGNFVETLSKPFNNIMTTLNDVSMADTINRVLPYMPKVLVNSPTRVELKKTARFFPAAWTSFFILECRLSPHENQVDFALAVIKEKDEFERLANLDPISPVWKNIRLFCRECQSPDSALYSTVDNVWLEFDINSPTSQLPTPGFFFGFKKETIVASNSWVPEKAIKLLLDRPLPLLRGKMLDRALTALPDCAELLQIGHLFSRSADALRLCIFPLLLADVASYLESLDAPLPAKSIESHIPDFEHFADHAALDIDILEAVQPKIGLEFFLEESPENNPRFHSFIEYLVANELCTAEKGAALLKWPGLTREKFRHLNSAYELLRKIDHIKLTLENHVITQAKLYLTAIIQPIEI